MVNFFVFFTQTLFLRKSKLIEQSLEVNQKIKSNTRAHKGYLISILATFNRPVVPESHFLNPKTLKI